MDNCLLSVEAGDDDAGNQMTAGAEGETTEGLIVGASLSADRGEDADNQMPAGTECEDTEEPIVGAFDISDWDYCEEGTAVQSTPATIFGIVANNYIDALKDSSGLHLVDEEGIKRAYRKHGELGLFSVFTTQAFKRSLRLWTNAVLSKHGLKHATAIEFDAYLGLAFAMSICPLNDISDFWSERSFLAQHDFVATMGRTRFQNIRSSIKIHPPAPPVPPDQNCPGDPTQARQETAEDAPLAPGQLLPPDPTQISFSPATQMSLQALDQPTASRPDFGVVRVVYVGVAAPAEHAATSTTSMTSPAQYDTSRDPPWHSRVLLQHIQCKFADVAVPYGVSSLDENSIRTKARTAAKSYIPSKSDKYTTRFYAVVGWALLYVHSMWDNGSGNFTRTIPPPSRYTATFPELKTSLNRTLAHPEINIERGSPSARWVAMMGHHTRRFLSPTGRRLMVSDNLYTRHVLAKALLKFTDSKTRLLGTVRVNLVDKWNKKVLSASVARVSSLKRGSWELVAAVDVEPGLEANITKHTLRQNRIAKARRIAYTPIVRISPFAGYIVFKDKQAVGFYSDDLHLTPPARILGGNDPRATTCVHGLYPIQRWTGSEIMHRTRFMVPTLVAAYNLAMNEVDRVDQLRSTNPTRRKEMRLSMSMLTWALDLCALNAYALLRKVQPADTKTISVREFKRRLAEALTAPALQQRPHGEGVSKRKRVQSLVSVVGTIGSRHILTPNSTKSSSGQLKCLLCSMRGLQRRSRWGCTSGEHGFYVECFAAFHFRDVFLVAAMPSVRETLDLVCAADSGNQPFCVRTKRNKSITPVRDLVLPQ